MTGVGEPLDGSADTSVTSPVTKGRELGPCCLVQRAECLVGGLRDGGFHAAVIGEA